MFLTVLSHHTNLDTKTFELPTFPVQNKCVRQLIIILVRHKERHLKKQDDTTSTRTSLR